MDAVKTASTQPETAAPHVGKYRRPAAAAAPVGKRKKRNQTGKQ